VAKRITASWEANGSALRGWRPETVVPTRQGRARPVAGTRDVGPLWRGGVRQLLHAGIDPQPHPPPPQSRQRGHCGRSVCRGARGPAHAPWWAAARRTGRGPQPYPCPPAARHPTLARRGQAPHPHHAGERAGAGAFGSNNGANGRRDTQPNGSMKASRWVWRRLPPGSGAGHRRRSHRAGSERREQRRPGADARRGARRPGGWPGASPGQGFRAGV